MKKIIILSLLFLTLTNCKKKETEEVIDATTETITANEIRDTPTTECYVYDADGSKIQLEMTNVDNEVSGILIYELKEKDSNKGTIKGTMNGDTLIANYTFQSEGTESTRQVAFLMKDNQLIEGYGEIVTEGNSIKFKDASTLDYSSNMPLSKVDCQK
jgi:hypothetical protein